MPLTLNSNTLVVMYKLNVLNLVYVLISFLESNSLHVFKSV